MFIIFYFSTKYLIMLGKVVDHGPHTNCTSHSLTFHPPMDLQPSFWASINNRESPSLNNPYILLANITKRYSRNTNIFQLCSLIFHKIFQGRNNNNNNVQKFLALCRKQVAKLDRLGICQIPPPSVIYELIGLLAHPIKSLTDRTNLKERLGIRFTKIPKRFVISE